jgi:hypothetical protein
MLAKYLKELGVQDFLFLLLPLILLVFWILFYRVRNYVAILILSILLVLLTLPNLLRIPVLFSAEDMSDSAFLLYGLFTVLLTVACLILGIVGIIASVRGFSGRSSD